MPPVSSPVAKTRPRDLRDPALEPWRAPPAGRRAVVARVGEAPSAAPCLLSLRRVCPPTVLGSVEHSVSSHTDNRLHKCSRILYSGCPEIAGQWVREQQTRGKLLRLRTRCCCERRCCEQTPPFRLIERCPDRCSCSASLPLPPASPPRRGTGASPSRPAATPWTRTR
jgi:hypothetical protein